MRMRRRSIRGQAPAWAIASGQPRPIFGRAGLAGCLLAAVMLRPVGAQEISVQTELDTRVTFEQDAAGRTSSAVRVEPRYQLWWRGPVQGGTRVYAEINSSGGLVSEPGMWGTQEDLQLNLHSQGPVLDLNLTLGRSSDSYELDQPDGTSDTVASRTDTVSVNGILSYPRYPLVSFNYQRAHSGGGGGDADTTTVAANYDMGPMRLSLDQTWQGGAGPGLSSTQYGANFQTALTPTTQLTAYHYGWWSHSGGGQTSSNQTTTARFTASPTPFVVLDGEVTYLHSSQINEGETSSSWTWGHNLTARSDPLPGVRLDVSERTQSGRSGAWGTDNQQFAASLGLTPLPEARLLAQYTSARYDYTGGPAVNRQEQEQVSFAVPLFGRTDFLAAYSRAYRAQGPGGSDDWSAWAGLTGDLNAQTTLSASYRYSDQHSWWSDGAQRDRRETLQASANWRPDTNWDFALGLSAIRASGIRHTTTLQPTAELRWNMAETTTLSARYQFQHVDERVGPDADPTRDFSGTSSYLDARLTHLLSDTESVEFILDSQEIRIGPSRLRNVCEFRWLKRF